VLLARILRIPCEYKRKLKKNPSTRELRFESSRLTFYSTTAWFRRLAEFGLNARFYFSLLVFSSEIRFGLPKGSYNQVFWFTESKIVVAKCHFGSLEKAAAELDLPYTPSNIGWSREKVLTEILERLEDGLPIYNRALKRGSISLCAVKQWFGGFDELYTELGMSREDVGLEKYEKRASFKETKAAFSKSHK
jgi:hypothetical protein